MKQINSIRLRRKNSIDKRYLMCYLYTHKEELEMTNHEIFNLYHDACVKYYVNRSLNGEVAEGNVQYFLGQMDFIKDILGNGIDMDEFSTIRMSAQIEAGNILKNFRL